MKRYLLFFLFFIVVTTSYASHIVGGEMSYKCLGNNQYEVKLQVFRDCSSSIIVWFDSLASIGIYQADGTFVSSIFVAPTNAFFLESPSIDECTIAPSDVCVESVTYIDTITLPFMVGGYHLVYQRCCRNVTVSNILDPLITGVTHTVFISEDALAVCNTSPVFEQWPPTFICAFEPISFDHSALDAQNDSVVYFLCAPLQGASFDMPQPQPPAGPPFIDVSFQEPTFSLINMLGSAINPLAIDSLTGVLTVTADIIGQFVVGVCANEYRDGELLSTIRRDFQYNVRECPPLVAILDVPPFVCNSLVAFIATQNGPDVTTQFNVFDEDSNLLSTSLAEFQFDFPGFGNYLVELIINPGLPCTDTVYQPITFLETPTVDPPTISNLPCIDGEFNVEVTIPSGFIDNPDIVSVYTQVLFNGTSLVNTSFDTVFIQPIVKDGLHLFVFTASFANGCTATNDVFETYNPIVNDPLDTIFICTGDTIYLNTSYQPTLYELDNVYSWLPPSPSVSNDTLPNPYTIYNAANPNIFLVTITNSAGCERIDTVSILVPEDAFSLDLGLDSMFSCAFPVNLTPGSSEPISTILWSLSPDLSDPFYFNLTLLTNPVPTNWVYTQATNAIGCVAVDSIFIQEVPLPVIDTVVIGEQFCIGQLITIDVDVTSILPYQLNVYPTSLVTQVDSNSFTINTSPFNVSLSIVALVTESCTAESTTTLMGVPDIQLIANAFVDPDTIWIDSILTDDWAQITTTVFNPFVGDVTYDWSPDWSLSSDSIPDPIATPDTTTTYTVLMTNELGCTAVDSITVWVLTIPIDTTTIPEDTVVIDPNDTLVEPVDTLVVVTCDTPFIFLPTGFSPNGDGHNDSWKLYGNQPVDKVTIMVYDRWGEQIFYSEDPNFVWDGTYRGVELPPDAYGFMLSYGCQGDPPKQLKGNVTIIR
jgi:gliding motility-associated-like protein